MTIRTKILATVGPASGSPDILGGMVDAGCDAFRINFSHGTADQREQFLANIRKVEQASGEPLAVVADLCGPKIRVGPIEGGSVLLAEGETIRIEACALQGNAERISVTRQELVDEVDHGEAILLDDGQIRLEVLETGPESFVCRIVRGGILSSGKGVNLPHTDLKLSALTQKDKQDAEWIAARDFDYVALSFVRSAGDVEELRSLLDAHGSDAHIIAKIEKPAALDQIESIVQAADAVMVARGDLGVEMELPEVPIVQKRIARLCQRSGKPCIIATQMLETMTRSATPTRAEVSDVANAVLDLADAVMLSGETAVGDHPVRTVEMMNEIVARTQGFHDTAHPVQPVRVESSRSAMAIAQAVRGVLEVAPVEAVAVYTATGTSARLLSKSRLERPILAMASTTRVARRISLYYAVEAVQADTPEHTRDILTMASKLLQDRQLARAGQKVVVVSGRPIGQPGATNTLVFHEVK
jgi:pyruvate kinase